jgi:FKBP-type peptidyl-prolyl cis-trans isomerase
MRTPLALAACVLTCSAFAQPGSTPATPTTPASQPQTAPPAQPLTAPGVSVPDGPVVQKTEIEGILIEDLKIGDGYEVKPGGAVVANYHGWLKDGGKVFDSTYDPSFKHAEPTGFSLTGVIDGWKKGVPGMKINGIRRLTIPSALAYGARGNPSVPPNSDLVFVIELKDAVQTEDIKVGDGEELVTPFVAETNYIIRDKEGKEIEKSDPAHPYIWIPNEFQGLQFGLEGMKVGGKRKISIPKEFNHSNPQLAPATRVQEVPVTVEVELVNARSLRPKTQGK